MSTAPIYEVCQYRRGPACFVAHQNGWRNRSFCGSASWSLYPPYGTCYSAPNIWSLLPVRTLSNRPAGPAEPSPARRWGALAGAGAAYLGADTSSPAWYRLVRGGWRIIRQNALRQGNLVVVIGNFLHEHHDPAPQGGIINSHERYRLAPMRLMPFSFFCTCW